MRSKKEIEYFEQGDEVQVEVEIASTLYLILSCRMCHYYIVTNALSRVMSRVLVSRRVRWDEFTPTYILKTC